MLARRVGVPLGPQALEQRTQPGPRVAGLDDLVHVAPLGHVPGGQDPEYREKFANPYVAAERGYVDEVIEPRGTRARLCALLERLRTKRDANPPRKHGNIPL